MNKTIDYKEIAKSLLFGVAIGDALGVPYEFKSRQTLKQNPAKGMIGNGTHNQPAGTFSDDSSLSFCLAEALTEGFDLNTIGQNFVKWHDEGYWTARGEVYDVGNATRQAINKLAKGVPPEISGGFEETDNGNGSLMRILPLIFYIKEKPIRERFEITKQVSSITHGHTHSIIACFYCLEFALQILSGKDKFIIYDKLKVEIPMFLNSISIETYEFSIFDRLLKGDIHKLHEDEIESSGYVLHTLEASIWCILNTNDYRSAVLRAVNLGDDSDTTASLTGGFTGLLYGIESIPQEWLDKLARRKDIEDLAQRLGDRCNMQ